MVGIDAKQIANKRVRHRAYGFPIYGFPMPFTPGMRQSARARRVSGACRSAGRALVGPDQFHRQRPPPSDHRVGISNLVTRQRVDSLAQRPATLPQGNAQSSIARTLLPGARKVSGQRFSRDFNLLEKTACYGIRSNLVIIRPRIAASRDAPPIPQASAKRTRRPGAPEHLPATVHHVIPRPFVRDP